ncbi:MAG: AMP nucleosidase [Spirochaetales bacterium]|jgi:AMP nucleosidase|nr:AMP nucleosidase [Spirochaetales bacterium]
MAKSLRPDSYARNTLERYTGSKIEDFCSNILLCNFQRYIESFAEHTGNPISSASWDVVHDKMRNVTIINCGVGSPNAGIVMHCLSFLDQINSVLMLGMCGGIDDSCEIGDLIVPTASIRDEGTSRHYLPANVPALPSVEINRIINEILHHELQACPKAGIMYTTDYRMWEFDEKFIEYILKHRIMAIDMEIATIFSIGYALNVPTAALMLISDLPLRTGGIKSQLSANKIFNTYTSLHLKMGVKICEAISKQHEQFPSSQFVHPVLD